MSGLFENGRIAVQAMRQSTMRPEREGEYWSNEEQEKLKRCFDEGVGITDIALLLHRSEAAVMQQIEKQDLFGRKANPKRRRIEKDSVCLCAACKAPDGLCPRMGHCSGCTEEDCHA